MSRTGPEDDRAFKIRAARAVALRARLPADQHFLNQLAERLADNCRLPLNQARARVKALAISAQPRPRGDGFSVRGGQ